VVSQDHEVREQAEKTLLNPEHLLNGTIGQPVHVAKGIPIKLPMLPGEKYYFFYVL